MRELLLRTGIASASCVLLVPARARAYEQKPPVSRVILIRHGESEGNVNFDIYRSTPDARIHLTQKGWTQAHEAGRLLGAMLGDSARVRVVHTRCDAAHSVGELRRHAAALQFAQETPARCTRRCVGKEKG